MSELRVDPLSGAWVLLAPGRAARPDTFTNDAAREDSAASCPFCPGHEHETPPETAREGGGVPDGPGWTIRVVPNKYPVVTAEGPVVRGAHEVVILSPDHHASFADLDADQARAVVRMLRDRVNTHLETGFEYAQAFVNFGAAAGASIAHPHAQVVALDVVPPAVATRSFRFASNPSLVSDLYIEAEELSLIVRRDEVVTYGRTVTWCPAASRSPYEMMVWSPSSGPRFDRADAATLDAVADALGDALRRVQRALGRSTPYNVVVDTGPVDVPYEWFVRVIPRLSVVAGFEQTTEVYVNTVRPEDAAEHLRTATT